MIKLNTLSVSQLSEVKRDLIRRGRTHTDAYLEVDRKLKERDTARILGLTKPDLVGAY